MERLRPRLLRTYAGPASRRGARREGAGGFGLRRQPPPSAPWISPQVDPRHFFSTSSSGGGSSASVSVSSTPSDDSDFLPSKRQRKRQQKPKPKAKKGGKENRAPKKGKNAGGGSPATSNKSATRDSVVPPTPLRRNITLRPQRQGRLRSNWGGTPSFAETGGGLWGRPPLLCSTPEQCHLPPVAKEDLLEEEEGVLQSSSGSILCSPYNCNGQQQLVLKEDNDASHNGLPELSSLNMNEDTGVQKMTGSLELFSQEDSRGPQQKSACEAPQRPLPSMTVSQWHLSQSHCTPLQSHSVLHSHSVQNESEASSENWEGLTSSPGVPALTPDVQGHHLQAANKDGQLPLSPKTDNGLLSTPHGALQLQAIMCNGKIALSLPKDALPLAKRQRISAQDDPTPEKKAADLNGTLSEEGSDCSIDQSSPHLQPVVVLDSQVVPDWLASQSTRKQRAGHLLQKKEYNLQPDSFCSQPRICDTRSNSQVVPTCGPGSTARKACISGFSTSRWVQQGKPGQVRHKKNMEQKQQTDASFFQQCLKWNEMENDMALSFLSPDCSLLKNSTWWRRIRASFSLHKKKKILSEAESFNSTASVQSPLEPPKTPFTQKLGYSICPSSSMVLLSAMKSSSKPEIILTDKEKVYGECQQMGPISFEECIPPEKMQKCEKIGEGVFGEVFRTDGERGPVALKIIPIEGSNKVNGEPQKTFSEILPEIIISKELSLLAEEEDNQTSGFISLYSVHCVQGAYPKCLLKAWDEYNRLRESENDRPDFFGNQQLFMILEFEFGGSDLENMQNRQLNSVAVAKSILFQVTASLAVAEEALHFEHRDLHWGNVLVKKTHLKELNFMLNGETHSVSTQGILVNIIDYTFSRLEKDGLTVYCDLSSDEEVFQGRGDYQFDIYRQMREENANNWADYFPHSNILWLHYLIDKLLKAVTYKKKPTTSSMRQVQKQLELFSNEVLGFRSARDLLNKCTFFH